MNKRQGSKKLSTSPMPIPHGSKRAVSAGFGFVDVHGANGYLINEFIPAHSHKRTNRYGGSFEHTIRFLLEVVESVRANIPDDYPLFLRWSNSELHDSNPDAWTVSGFVNLAATVVERGVDLTDVSGGGNDANADKAPNFLGCFLMPQI